jgi:hypothetical protein
MRRALHSIATGICFRVCFVLPALLHPAKAASQPPALSPEINNQINNQITLKHEVPSLPTEASNWKFQGSALFEGDQYQSPIPENSKLDQSLLASVWLKVDSATSFASSAADIKVAKYLDWGGSQFGVRELYTSSPNQAAPTTLSLGRRIQFWSQLDQDWELGLWQPLSVLDALRPDEQGLTGVFYQYKNNDFNFLFLGSPVHIPSMQPEVKEIDGDLVSNNRWYRSPSNSFMLFGQQRKVVYSLTIPGTSELVNKPGAGLRFRWGKEREGAWISTNAGYKAMNSLLVKYDKKLALAEEGSDSGVVPLTGAVGYHSLFGTDLGYQFPALHLSVSYLEDHPVASIPDDKSILQNPKPMKAAAFHTDGNVAVWGLDQPVVLGFDYLRITGGEIRDYDNAGVDRGAVFEQRFNFTHAASIRGEISTFLFRKKLTTGLRYMRELDQRGLMINGEAHYFAMKSLALLVGADVLGVDDSSETNLDSRFLNQYRANDRVYAGVSYVF